MTQESLWTAGLDGARHTGWGKHLRSAKVLREASPGLQSGRPPLSTRDPFQDPYWLPETMDFQYICIYDKVEFIN